MVTFTTGDARNLTMAIKVNGRTRWVKFTFPVIYGNKGKSTFSTCDKALVDALKAHPEYGSLFYIMETIDEPNTEDSDAYTTTAKTIEDELRDPANPIIVESVTTKGMAAAYIQGMYGESFTATSVEEMKREAARKWNILFPKWGK
jgi:hypothetical protein